MIEYFKTWFYGDIYTNYYLILQICKVWVVVYMSYFIKSVLFVMLWMDECLQAVVIHLLFVYFYTTSQGHSVDLQLLYLYFFAITVPDKIWFIQHFYIFFKINFCIFYHILKNQHVWGHSFKKSKMASILLVVLMVCICSDR